LLTIIKEENGGSDERKVSNNENKP
jgi:hypothetical protein